MIKTKAGRITDEKDSTTSVWMNYLLASGVIGALIALDFYTDKGYLDGTIIGMILMKALDGLTKMNDYFFPGRRNFPDGQRPEESKDEPNKPTG